MVLFIFRNNQLSINKRLKPLRRKEKELTPTFWKPTNEAKCYSNEKHGDRTHCLNLVVGLTVKRLTTSKQCNFIVTSYIFLKCMFFKINDVILNERDR